MSDATSGVMRVVEITTTDTHALRRAVLRNADPARSVDFPEDDLPGTFHLGVVDSAGRIVATSSWVPKPSTEFPAATAVQLRGMATDASMQGTGVGGLLIEAGAQRCAAAGFDLLWARARDSALAFYAKHACRVVGDGFVDATTGLPHHVVVRDLT
ncbi:MAG: hypothetical protein JWN39_2813 [Ilumatobacteraceae bacterium]|nr:hypothetical protein [Ilumatobacteraceae bacterium]